MDASGTNSTTSDLDCSQTAPALSSAFCITGKTQSLFVRTQIPQPTICTAVKTHLPFLLPSASQARHSPSLFSPNSTTSDLDCSQNAPALSSTFCITGKTQSLFVLTKFHNQRFEFIFTTLSDSTLTNGLFHAVMAVFRSYDGSRLYRDLKLRGGGGTRWVCGECGACRWAWGKAGEGRGHLALRGGGRGA